MSAVRTYILTGFDDPACPPDCWQRLLERGETDVVFLTRGWLKAWWETLGKGSLLLIAAESAGEVVALAPLYSISGMVYFLGAGESDYFDFIGDTSEPDIVPAILREAMRAVPGFLGMQLHLVPGQSRTGARLQEAARLVGLDCYLGSELATHDVDLLEHREAIRTATNRSMLKREEFFRQNGEFSVAHYRDGDAVRPFLGEFIAQHIARWQVKSDYRSPLERADQRAFLERLVQVASEAGWLRFLRIEWRGLPLAMAFAWYYRGMHFSGPWSFDLAHGKHCPGHVLLRHSLLAALDEGLRVYDLRGGDDPYKSRLPARAKTANTWGLYPP